MEERDNICAMTTTLDIPDKLLREAQAEAAGHGLSLQDFVAEAIRSKLHVPAPSKKTTSIMDFAGIFRSSQDESLRIMETIEAGCEQVRSEDWR